MGTSFHTITLSADLTGVCILLPGTEINRIKRNFQGAQSRRGAHLRGISDELQGVQHIMFENIDAVLQRGELIESTVYEIKRLLKNISNY